LHGLHGSHSIPRTSSFFTSLTCIVSSSATILPRVLYAAAPWPWHWFPPSHQDSSVHGTSCSRRSRRPFWPHNSSVWALCTCNEYLQCHALRWWKRTWIGPLT
jgi:hypothetical protein